MEFWVALPYSGRVTTAQLIREIAVEAEALGFTGLVMGDHLAVPREAGDRQGFTFESLVTLAHVAAVTERIRLGSSVIVAPLRNAVLLAKQVATLDQLSNGRVILGLGVGYNRGEFANLGADYHTRGAYTEETIHLIRHLFAGSGEPFRGRFHVLEDYQFHPTPVQGPGLPILIGGRSAPAELRAGRIGDLWSAGIEIEEWPAAAARVRAAAAEAGRRVRVGTELRWGTDVPGELAPGIQLRGETPAQLRAHVKQYEEAGCDLFIIGFGPVAEYPTSFIPKMRLFAQEVVPAFTRGEDARA